jgi:hypothetical protein
MYTNYLMLTHYLKHTFGIVEISVQVHNFLNGGKFHLVDQPLSSSFWRSLDLKKILS